MKALKYLIVIVFFIQINESVVSAQNGYQSEDFPRPFLGLSRDKHTSEIILSIDPFYLLNRELRLSLERQINHNPDKYLMLTLSGNYYPEKNDMEWQSLSDDCDNFIKAVGYGISGAYKQFFPYSRVYWMAGVRYNYSHVKYFSYDYYSYTENGLQFYEYLGKDIKKNFHKISPNLNIGIQTSIYGYVFIDIFVGLAYNYSFYDGKKIFDSYNDFGYRGISLNGGINIGFPLKR